MEDLQLLINHKEKIRNVLQDYRKELIGNNYYFPAEFLGEKLLVCFSQPDNEELREVCKRSETIIYL